MSFKDWFLSVIWPGKERKISGLSAKTIGALLEENAKKYGNQTAVVYSDENIRYSWRQLNRLADEAAKGFLAIGVKAGNHIAMWGTNRPEWLITQFAAAKIGAALVAMNPEWKTEDLEYALKQSDSKILVMQRGFTKESGGKNFSYDYVTTLQKIALEIKKADPENLKLKKLPALKCVVLISKEKEKGMLKWDVLLSKADSVNEKDYIRHKKSVDPYAAALVQYTSGTTGFPKGAMLSQYGIVNNAFSCAKNLKLTSKDRICGPIPYCHIFCSATLNVCCLVTGAAMVVPAEHFNARKTLEAIEKERCTAIYGVPTMFISQLADPEFSRFDLGSLRTGIMAGAPCPIELMKDVVFKMGVEKMTIAYGLTEASPMTHQTGTDDSIERRTSTVGKPLQNTEAKIVDPQTFKELGANETGEIWVRGYHVMLGYYNNPAETEKTIIDGWLRTGDLGIKDADGYYKIVGRLKEMFIVGGHNVYPAEIEQALRSNFENEIEDVYVFGVPHQTLQEIGAAAVKLKSGKSLTEEEIKSKCADLLEWPKVPKYIKFVNDFTNVMTPTGKIQKKKLKEILVKELGLEELEKIKTA